MVSQASYHAHHSDPKRGNQSYSPYMPTNRYTESRVYVPNNDHRSLLSDPLDKGEGAARKRIAVACGRCRQRKIRCSGDKGQNLPCTNCQNAGVTPCLFLRVSSREATIKGDFDYNTNISRALAHRVSIPPPPPPLSTNGSHHYGSVHGDLSPSGSGSGGGPGDPYRSASNVYPYSHKSFYNSLPPSPWTPGYSGDCGTPTDYATPQPCSPYGVVGSDQASQLMPPYTWDGRTPAGPPPPPLTLKVQAPQSASTMEPTGVAPLPPPHPTAPVQPHPLDQHRAQPQTTGGQDHCPCPDCEQEQAQAQTHAHTSNVSSGAPEQHTDLGPVSSQEHDGNQYIHGELVYRPALNGSPEADVGADSDYHQASSMHSALARSSIESIDRLGCNDNNASSSCSNGNSNDNIGNGCETTVRSMQAAPVPMSRVPSHGSAADHGAVLTLNRFKQDMISNRSAAPSPAPMQASMQAPMPTSMQTMQSSMPAPLPPLNTGSVASSPYVSGHVSAANSSENLARISYSTAVPGSIFSDQERDVVGTQGPGPVACLDSYTYDSGSAAKVLSSSLSSSSLHGIYGRQNRKKSSADSLVKTRPYSPTEGPMLPPSHHHHNHGHGSVSSYMATGRPTSTPDCGSPLLPPPIHMHHDLHDIKVDPSCQSHSRR